MKKQKSVWRICKKCNCAINDGIVYDDNYFCLDCAIDIDIVKITHKIEWVERAEKE